ncbi:hypothetical protein DRM94_20860 [Aeromonas taiwanensis]|uniref:Uncharacterized protein n=1 Tax=Aeromonas taiwanensis TaxID=633417 RepID=A0A5F0K484_9GAMM|nr:hypothetical protein [Aeromonas taiwanensis]TFF70834.1 hypothetical protein DRM93_20860 [Aeromonas taiwanensis]TFF71517.1 hypothetical protein DRM95_21330 [Aeromonas taiwanensis]TFF73813.1 hypothetical protein DRM94_20860 [Aeromonas taiwanensis]
MTIEQLARSTRSVFELHHESLTGLPFFTSFPLNCCQGASVVFGVLVSLLPTQHMVTVVKGDTRDRRESHYWLEIDGLIYDLTLDQFQETLGNRFDGIDAPLYGVAKHPLRMHFFYKERHSAVLAFSIFCQRHANSEGVDAALQFVRRELTKNDDCIHSTHLAIKLGASTKLIDFNHNQPVVL